MLKHLPWLPFRRRYHMLDGDGLRPGDIVLSTQRAKPSWVIRSLTWSPFSHAAIVLDNGLYAEAVGLGVRVRSIGTVLRERLMVLRLPPTDSGSEQVVAQRAVQATMKYVYAGYWVSGAMLSLFRNVKASKRNLLFCSHLVAQAYEDAGARIVGEIQPDKTTPALLARSKYLRDVSSQAVFRPKLVPSYLLSPDFETMSDRETLAVQSVYAALMPYFKARGLKAPSSWLAMLVVLAGAENVELQRSLDRKMAQTLIEQGYLKLTSRAIEECIRPMEKVLAQVRNKDLPLDHAKMDYYLLNEGLKSLQRQAATDEGNKHYFLEEHKRTHLGTFELLALDSKVRAATTHRMIELTVDIMNSLYTKYSENEPK